MKKDEFEYLKELTTSFAIETPKDFGEFTKEGKRTMFVVPANIMQVMDKNELWTYVEI